MMNMDIHREAWLWEYKIGPCNPWNPWVYQNPFFFLIKILSSFCYSLFCDSNSMDYSGWIGGAYKRVCVCVCVCGGGGGGGGLFPLHGWINSLGPRLNRRPFADGIFKCIFLNVNEWILPRISMKFVSKVRIDNIPALVQIMAWRRPGDKPLSEPMIVSLLTHICVTRPQWVKSIPILTGRGTESDTWGLFYWHRLTLIPALISTYIHHRDRVWNEITYPFPNFNGCNLKYNDLLQYMCQIFNVDFQVSFENPQKISSLHIEIINIYIYIYIH